MSEAIAELFGAVEMGDLEVVIGEVRPLSEAKAVHHDLAARRTQGLILLDPHR
jgi:NADPH:quinone reductase-like Zn-dependent oxidoreductase